MDQAGEGVDAVSATAYSNLVTGFTKLFSGIVFSTVWREEMHVKVVWVTMLALANQRGEILASLPGLADAARVSLDQCKDALDRLSAPDEYSRTKDHEGRRIEDVDGGWRLLNYIKYRELRNADERRIQTREAVRRHRAKQEDLVSKVSNVSQSKPKQKQKQKQKQSKEIKSGADAPTKDFAYFMGLFREVWEATTEEQLHNGSILKALLARGNLSGEFESAVRGLPLVIGAGRRPSLKWLYATGSATDMFKKSVDAYYSADKKPRARQTEPTDPEHISVSLRRFSERPTEDERGA